MSPLKQPKSKTELAKPSLTKEHAMNSDKAPADVIEQAAKVALDAMEAKQRADKEAVRSALGDLDADLDSKEHGYHVEAWEVARALAVAGLLAHAPDSTPHCHVCGPELCDESRHPQGGGAMRHHVKVARCCHHWTAVCTCGWSDDDAGDHQGGIDAAYRHLAKTDEMKENSMTKKLKNGDRVRVAIERALEAYQEPGAYLVRNEFVAYPRTRYWDGARWRTLYSMLNGTECGVTWPRDHYEVLSKRIEVTPTGYARLGDA